jgi:hypothetical protein
MTGTQLQPEGVWGEESVAPTGATKFTGPFSPRISFSGPLAGFGNQVRLVFGLNPPRSYEVGVKVRDQLADPKGFSAANILSDGNVEYLLGKLERDHADVWPRTEHAKGCATFTAMKFQS